MDYNNTQWKYHLSQPNYACSLYYNLHSITCFGLYAGHLQVLSYNITKVKLLIFSRGSTEVFSLNIVILRATGCKTIKINYGLYIITVRKLQHLWM
jgi:hypothetical protein